MGSFLYAAGEADAQGKGKGHGPPDKASHGRSGAPPSARPTGHSQPAGRSSHQPSSSRSASRPAGHAPAYDRPENTPNRGGGARQPAALGPAHRAQGQPSNRQPVYARPDHRGPVHRDPAYREPPAHGRTAGDAPRPAVRPVDPGPRPLHGQGAAEPPGQAGPHGAATNPPGWDKRSGKANGHEVAGPPGQTKHHGSAKPAEPPERARHYEAGKTTGPEKAAPVRQVRQQDPPRPVEHGGAEPAEQERMGPVVAAERAGRSEHAGRRIGAPQPASFSGREGKELSGPVGPSVDRAASRRVVPSVERPSTPSRVPEGEIGSRLEAVVSAGQQAFAKRASSTFEQLWGAVGSVLEQVGGTTRGILEPVASFLAGARPAGDLGGRSPPAAPLPTPSGTGLLGGNSLSEAGSSGGGFGPLLAVLALLAVAASRGRFRDLYEIAKPGLVVRLTPERPG